MALDLGIFLEGSQSTFKVKVSDNDSQAQYLLDKLTSSDGSVTITEINDGGVEQINLTTSGGGGISSPLTTKGDLFTYDTDNQRLGVGTDGQALIADSAEPTGLRWGTVSGDNMATADLTLTGDRTHDLNGNVLKFDNGQVTIEGVSTSSSQLSLLVQNSSANQLFKIDNSGGFALGLGATYGDKTNVAIGDGATANNTYSVAIGDGATSTSFAGIAIGGNTNTGGGYNVVIGYGASSSSTGDAIGYNASTTSGSSLAVGAGSSSAASGIAIGKNALNSGYGVALGFDAETTSNYAGLAVGNKAKTTGNSMIFSASSYGAVRTNSTVKSAEFYLNDSTATLRFGETVDGWLNTTGSFGFGTTLPEASSVVTLSSTTKGFLPPVMTTTQKNNIVAPATGLTLYDSTLNKLCVYTGLAWETVTSA